MSQSCRGFWNSRSFCLKICPKAGEAAVGARFPGCTSSGVPGGDILWGQGVSVRSGSHRLEWGSGGTGAPRSGGHGRLPACAPWDAGGDPWQQLGEEGLCHLLTPSWTWVRRGVGARGGHAAPALWQAWSGSSDTAGRARSRGLQQVAAAFPACPQCWAVAAASLWGTAVASRHSCARVLPPAMLTPGGPRRLGSCAAGRGRLARASQPRGDPEAPEDDGLAGAVALGAPLSCCPEVLTAPRGP